MSLGETQDPHRIFNSDRLEGCAPSSLGPAIILFETVQYWTVIVAGSVHDVHRRAFVQTSAISKEVKTSIAAKAKEWLKSSRVRIQ